MANILYFGRWSSRRRRTRSPPKEPHPKGLLCKSCGTDKASQWRGPGGQFCSKCKKEAGAARAALKADPRDAQIEALSERLHNAEELIEKLTQSYEELVGCVSEQAATQDEQKQEMETMRAELAGVAKQASAAKTKAARAKRAAFGQLPPRPPPAQRR